MNDAPAKKNSRRLRLQAGEIVEGVVPVEWRIDESLWKGVINVKVPSAAEDPQVIAELCALRHLVVVRTIFGNPVAPAGAEIVISSGAIKKLWRQDTAKEHIVQYGRFLYATFEGCEMEVKKDRALSGLPVREIITEGEEPRLDVDAIVAAPSPFPELKFRALGDAKVGISRHALERYQERFDTKQVKSSMAGIRRMADSEQMIEIDKGERSRLKALIRHQTNARLFRYQPSKTILVLVPEATGWVLATVYREDESLTKQAVYAGGRIEFRNRD